MREIDVVFDPERKLFLYFGVAFLGIAVGPFGTYEAMDFWERTVFWMLDILGGLAILLPILHVFFHSRLVALIPPLPRFVMGVALGALPTSAYITVLFGTIGADLHITTPFPLLFVQVTLFSCTLLIVEFVLWPMLFGASDPHPAPPAAPPPAPGPQPVALLSRLPAELHAGEILSISMQDHYAEVTTTKGAALILMRLADAMDLLEGCPGLRIHRSHWVALEAVEGVDKAGRRTEVVLSDGRRLPVGATYLNAVQTALGGQGTEETS